MHSSVASIGSKAFFAYITEAESVLVNCFLIDPLFDPEKEVFVALLMSCLVLTHMGSDIISF